MYLHRIHLNLRCREARRDLADPYQLHSTLCRAFSVPETKCPESTFLWRLEPESDQTGHPRILVQSREMANWDGVGVSGWLARAEPPINLQEKLSDSLRNGQRFRFRLRANPCVTRNGKRLGLLRTTEQETWLVQKGTRHGFTVPGMASFDLGETDRDRPDIRISQERMLRGKKHNGVGISIFSALYDGILVISECTAFGETLKTGIGHGKALGLGLLSLVPLR
jgi:CRISPR system Cascade subunit CasE